MRNKVKNFTLVNTEKIKRVLASYKEKNKGKEISDNDLLVAYDKLGGLIIEVKKVKKVEVKCQVVTGSFYDFEAKKGRKKPKLTYK